jgi:hypothetical protein
MYESEFSRTFRAADAQTRALRAAQPPPAPGAPFMRYGTAVIIERNPSLLERRARRQEFLDNMRLISKGMEIKCKPRSGAERRRRKKLREAQAQLEASSSTTA